MKFTCEKKILIDAVTNVSKAITERAPFPALAGMKMTLNKRIFGVRIDDFFLSGCSLFGRRSDQPGTVTVARYSVFSGASIPGSSIRSVPPVMVRKWHRAIPRSTFCMSPWAVFPYPLLWAT